MITIVNSPSQNHAHTEAIFRVSTTRPLPGSPKSVSGIGQYAGKLTITTSAAHGLESADVIQLAGFSGLEKTRTRVTVQTSTTVICDNIQYAAGISYSGATIQKDNRKVRIRASVLQGSTVLATLESWTHQSGVFEFDFSQVLERAILSQWTPQGSITSTGIGVSIVSTPSTLGYAVQFAEWMEDAAGKVSAVVAAGATATSGGVNAHYLRDLTYSDVACTSTTAGRWLTPVDTHYLRVGETAMYEIISDNACTVEVRRYFTDGSSALSTYNLPAGRIQLIIGTGAITSTLQRITAVLKIGGVVRSNTLTIYTLAKSKTTHSSVAWLNEFGAVAYYYPAERRNETTFERTTAWDSDGYSQTAWTRAIGEVVIPVVLDDSIYPTIYSLVTASLVWLDGKNASVQNTSLPGTKRELQEYELKLKTRRR